MRALKQSILALAIVLVSTGCSDTVEFGKGEEAISYDCGSFTHQAKNERQLRLLAAEVNRLAHTLLDAGEEVSAQGFANRINEAQRESNIVELERQIVKLKCEVKDLPESQRSTNS